MMNESNELTHIDAGDLVRLIDGELSLDDRAALDSHLSRCRDCVARREAVRGQASAIRELLRSADVTPPATPLRVAVAPVKTSAAVRWRAAAVVALVVAGAVAAPPVRAWIANVARAAWSSVTGGKNRPVSQFVPVEPGEAGAVSFVPVGSTFTISVPAPAPARVIVEAEEGNRVSVIGSRGQPVPGLVVLPSEVRFTQPSGGSGPDYFVRVPLTLQSINIVIGGRSLQTLRPVTAGERWTVPLGPDR